MTFMTKPETCVDRSQRKRIVAEIVRRNGCAMCEHRDKAREFWDLAFCSRPSRTFPLCMKDKREPEFKLDHDTIGVKP